MSHVVLQNFDLPAGDDVTITLDIGPDAVDSTLAGCTLYWQVFEQVYGIPTNPAPIITKNSNPDGGITIISPTDQTAEIIINRSETLGLIRNYYHEVMLEDANGHHVTTTYGILAFTNTEIHKFETILEPPAAGLGVG